MEQLKFDFYDSVPVNIKIQEGAKPNEKSIEGFEKLMNMEANLKEEMLLPLYTSEM